MVMVRYVTIQTLIGVRFKTLHASAYACMLTYTVYKHSPLAHACRVWLFDGCDAGSSGDILSTIAGAVHHWKGKIVIKATRIQEGLSDQPSPFPWHT